MKLLTLSLEETILVTGQLMSRKKFENIGCKEKQVLFDIVMKSYF